MTRIITADEVEQHNKTEDLWVVIGDTVWDVTEFAPDHPGGFEVIRKVAGKDATALYSSVHPPSLLQRESSVHIVGKLDPSTPKSWSGGQPGPDKPASAPAATIPGSQAIVQAPSKPELETLISYHDFENAAQTSLSAKTWAFYSSAATDCITDGLNNAYYNRILLRPRILRDSTLVDTTCTIFGRKSTLPFFCAPAALARLAHPDGEMALARVCAREGIPQGISNNASYPIEDIVESVTKDKSLEVPEGVDMTFFFQLYVDRTRSKSEALLKRVEALGCKGVIVTVDASTNGKRELDEKVQAEAAVAAGPAMTQTPTENLKKDKKGGGIARLMSGFIDPALVWDDIAWLRRSTKLPLILKGIMTWQDAVLAAKHGLDGIILSNHGGRNLDTSPPAILTLLEIQRNAPWVFAQLEINVDGGIKRGTDIFKALCLGASSVEIGRGFLYSVNYGEEGVERFISMLRDELETTMRLMGVNNLKELHPGMVSTLDLDHLVSVGDQHPWAKGIAKARL